MYPDSLISLLLLLPDQVLQSWPQAVYSSGSGWVQQNYETVKKWENHQAITIPEQSSQETESLTKQQKKPTGLNSSFLSWWKRFYTIVSATAGNQTELQEGPASIPYSIIELEMKLYHTDMFQGSIVKSLEQ